MDIDRDLRADVAKTGSKEPSNKRGGLIRAPERMLYKKAGGKNGNTNYHRGAI
jgi:hypothetical protein